MTEQDIIDMGYITGQDHGDFIVAVGEMTYGKGRIIIGNDMGVDNAWCYKTLGEALLAYVEWEPTEDNEPDGWFRNPITGRRRPDNDPDQEYIRP